MNIALPAVLIILGLLPGILFFNSYFSGRFPRQLSGVSGVSELAQYFVFAIPLDALALSILHAAWGVTPRYDLLARVLTGPLDREASRQLALFLQLNWAVCVRSYLGTLLASLIAGNGLRRFVWALRLDVRVRFLQMKHDWFYTLQGRLPGYPRDVMPYGDLLVEHGKESEIYQGLIASFEPDDDGSIRRITLNDARRKPPGPRQDWRDIPGNELIVMGSVITSVNVTYIKLEVADDRLTGLPRLRREAWRVVRSFVLQAP